MNIVFLQKNAMQRAVFESACSFDYLYPSWTERKQFQFRAKSLSPLRI